MHRRTPYRTLLIVLVLAIFTVLQSAAAMAAYSHHHGGDHTHCCAVCHAGHLAVLKTAAAWRVTRPHLVESHLALQECRSRFDYRGITRPSRAPPTNSTASV